MLPFNRADLTWRVSGVVINREGDEMKMVQSRGKIPEGNSHVKRVGVLVLSPG